MGLFKKISNGWKLAMDSFSVLNKNKTLLTFPALSIITLLLIFTSLIGGICVEWDSIKKIDDIILFFIIFIFIRRAGMPNLLNHEPRA